jgi:asparagine synthase (glutamine-hydrolysing)
MLYQTLCRDWPEGSFEMGALVAVLNKRGEDAVGTALAMVEAMNSNDSEAYGIASSTIVRTEGSLSILKKTNIESSTAVGYAFSKILPKDKPQPLKLEDAAMVFDGRLYPVETAKPDAEIAAKKLEANLEQAATVFVKKTNGDFAFAIAKPEKIITARDSMGVRPLYYGENAEFAALASERKALWSIGMRETASFPPGCVSLVERSGFKFTVARTITYSRPKRITMQTAAPRLRTLLEHSVRERVSGLKEVVIAFSGGLDSSIIASLAKKAGSNVILIHVSLENEPEVEYAQQAAEELKLPLYCYLHDEHEVLQTIPKVIGAIEEPQPVKVSIGIPIYWTAEKTAEMDFRVMLAGQGADELFGGYKRYLDEYLGGGSEKAQKAIFNDIIGMYEDNLERDSKICNHLNVELRLPFATISMAKFAINLPLELKMERTSNTLRKLVLRRVAKDLLLPQSIVDRPKRAIQYTTGINKALKKLAKQEGVPMAEYFQKVFEKTFGEQAPHD